MLVYVIYIYEFFSQHTLDLAKTLENVMMNINDIFKEYDIARQLVVSRYSIRFCQSHDLSRMTLGRRVLLI